LIDSFDIVRLLRVPDAQLDNLDFFSASPEEWTRWQAKKQDLLDKLIAGDNYDPLDPSQRHLKSRLRKELLKDYVNYNDYNPFGASVFLQLEPVEPEPAAATYTSLDDEEDGCNNDSISVSLYRHVISRLQKDVQKAVKNCKDCNDYKSDSFDSLEQHESRRPPKFISCPNGTLFCVLSHNDSKKILDTSRSALENIFYYESNFVLKQYSGCL